MNKAFLRQTLCRKRQALSQNEQEAASKALAVLFCHRPEFINCHTIAGYWPIMSEMNPLPLLEMAFLQQKQCFLPVISHQKSEKMLSFVEYQTEDPLTLNSFGILEPYYQKHKVISANELDIVLMPLVAFDKHGRRLGMGGGYYDRTFAFLRDNKLLQKPQLIGLAYDWQAVECLPQDNHDILLSAIATDKQFISIV